MSSESPAVSRPPQSNSAPEGSGSETPKSVSRDGPSLSDLPDPAEKVREFLDEMGDRAHLRVSGTHDRDLRAECVEDVVVSAGEVQLDDGSTVYREETNTYAVEWWRAVAEMLDWHAEYHRSTLRLEYGTEADPTHELLDVPLDNSWMAAYQDKERARLKALERQTCGYDTCDECDTRWCQESDEHDTERVAGTFEEPVVALTGRTAAGDGRPSVDHARAIAEAWTGPNGNDGAGRSLRYVLDERLGLESDEWVRWTQGEPHTGKRSGGGYGGNTGYHHAHDIIILDGAAAAESVTAETFQTVIEAHVEKCDGAGREAHDLDKSAEQWAEGDDVSTVSVKEVDDEIEESVASYAAAYLANESKDLLERSPEYLAWAATMWATGTQKGIKSDSANHAVAADRCHHKHADGEQEIPHAAEVRRSPCRCAEAPYGPGCGRCDGRGYHIVCSMCGSPWDVEQDQTLTAHRTADGAHAAADGGAVPDDETPEQVAEQDLRDRWPSARRAAVVGGPTADRGGVRVEDGRELEGRVLKLGGGESYCAACGEVSPSEGAECPAGGGGCECGGVGRYLDKRAVAKCGTVGLRLDDGEVSVWYRPVVEPAPCDCSGPSRPHMVVEGRSDASVRVVTGSEQYRGTGHVPLVYDGPPDGESVTAGFERPPKWKAKAVVRDGEEMAATGGGVDMRSLDLPSAPVRVVSMAARAAGDIVCPDCVTYYESPAEYVRDGCECGRVSVGWMAATAPPAQPATLSRGEFVEAVPDRLLDDGTGEAAPAAESGPEVPAVDTEQVREYVASRPAVTVAEVMGRFGVPPSARDVVAEVVE